MHKGRCLGKMTDPSETEKNGGQKDDYMETPMAFLIYIAWKFAKVFLKISKNVMSNFKPFVHWFQFSVPNFVKELQNNFLVAIEENCEFAQVAQVFELLW